MVIFPLIAAVWLGMAHVSRVQHVHTGVGPHCRGGQEVGLRAEVAKVLHRRTDRLPGQCADSAHSCWGPLQGEGGQGVRK